MLSKYNGEILRKKQKAFGPQKSTQKTWSWKKSSTEKYATKKKIRAINIGNGNMGAGNSVNTAYTTLSA